MELPAAAGSGSGQRSTSRSVKRSLEYPCVSRFRTRRLLAYLSARRFDDAFESVALNTFVLFRVDHLQSLARSGRWLDAIKYVARFAPSDRTLGQEGQLFVNFVYMHHALNSIVAEKPYGALVAGDYKRHLDNNPNAPPGNVKLVGILLSVLNSHKLRSSINWNLVRDKAADILEDLIALIPEFKDLLQMPNCSTSPRNVLPIGISRSRRHVKAVDRLQAVHLARLYLEKKKRLPSKDSFGLSVQATARLADLLAESVEAGMCQVPRDPCPRAGVPGVLVTHADLSTMISPPEKSVISSEAIAGTTHPICIEADHDSVPRHISKRPRTTELQALNTRKRQTTEEFLKHSGLSSQAYCVLGDERVGDVGSSIKSWST